MRRGRKLRAGDVIFFGHFTPLRVCLGGDVWLVLKHDGRHRVEGDLNGDWSFVDTWKVQGWKVLE